MEFNWLDETGKHCSIFVLEVAALCDFCFERIQAVLDSSELYCYVSLQSGHSCGVAVIQCTAVVS